MSEKQGISKFAARAMLTYGHYTLFNRAVPEFRDGLKPVHRAAVWAAHTLGMNSKGKFHKCALLVGDVIGNYHPHGDCLRGDTVVPLLDGREVTIRELVEAGSPRKWVLAFDEAAGNYVPAVAHSWRVGQTTRKMYRVTFSTGETLEVTGNHPFYSLTRNKWVQARKLRSDEEVAGGTVSATDVTNLISVSVPVRSVDVVELPEEEDFYDFTVDGLHNMIVRTQAGSENFVVVHNSSVYEATVGISGTRKEGKKEWTVRHCVAPLFEGYGNFGDFEDGPAAYRYTEARLSPIAEHLLLDPDYLAVTPMVMNYSGTKQMPLSLPAKLPLMMVNGGTTLAVGMSGGIPSYSVPDVLDLAIKALEGRVTNKDIAAKKPTSSYGGRCVSTTKDEPYRSYVLTGKGSVRYQPDYVVDERKRTITLTSVCVGLDKASSIVKFMTAVNDLPDVMRVVPSTGNGVYSIVIRCKPRGSDFEETLDKIVKLMTTSVSYDVVRLSRESEDEMSVAKLPILQLLTDWAAYRISLQTDVTNYRIQRVEQRVERIDLLIKAVDCLEIIMKSLRVDDSEAYLVRHMKVTPEQAHDILEMRVRQLKSLEKRKLLEERKACMTTLKTLRIDLKYPAKAAIRETVEAVDAIKKSGFL